MFSLPHDLIDLLCSWLNPLDIYRLRTLCMTASTLISYESLHKSALIEVNERLIEVFGDNTEEFKRSLGTSVISGSFLVQSLIKEDWTESDIDIYVSSYDDNFPDVENFTELENFLFRIGKWCDGYDSHCYGDV